MTSATYQGAEGWAGPVRVLYRDRRPVACTCLICGERWDLQVLTADEHGRTLGPLLCPHGCEADPAAAEALQPGTGFRPISNPHD
jgi:hypothetical protein